MINVKIKCRNCHTILDNTKFTEERAKFCKCKSMHLDWHGHVMGGDFSLIDAMGNEKEQKEYIDLYLEYKEQDNKLVEQLIAFKNKYEKEWDEFQKKSRN